LPIKSPQEIQGFKKPWIRVQGRYYNIKELVDIHMRTIGPNSGLKGNTLQEYAFDNLYGDDMGKYFFKQDLWSRYCPGIVKPPAGWDYLDPKIDWMKRPTTTLERSYFHRANDSDGNYVPFLDGMNKYVKGYVGWTREYLKNLAAPDKVKA
jgi:chitin synthase